MQSTHSKFWIGSTSSVDVLTGQASNGKDYVKLASTLRAVSNFVNIVTGKSIPVQYKGANSYTDGKSIVISSNVKDNNFDPTVGLALHEGSHVKLTDFKVLDNFKNNVEVQDPTFMDEMEQHQDAYDIYHQVKDILNYVEDRRIDYFIYTNAPGYKPYYKAMYDKYFNSKAVDKGLKSTEYRTEDWDSYMFRLINITNSNRDLNALKGLKEIWNILDLGNVSRLESTKDALKVSMEIYRVIEECTRTTGDFKNKEEEKGGEGKSGDCEGKKGEPINGDGGDAGEDDGSTAEGEDVEDTTPGEFDLNDREKKMLKNAIQKQKDFTDGKVKKSNMSKADKKRVTAISRSGASTKAVGNGANNNSWRVPTIDCVVVEKLNKEIIASDAYSCILYDSSEVWENSSAENQQEYISTGVRLGTVLGRKLEVRNQSNTIKHNRLRTGKIDRRAIASLGFGAEAVFQKVVTSSHNAACLHISIDASGSMNGERWRSSQIAAVAIAKAASMTNNMDVVISYRSIYTSGLTQPLVLIAYDSRKDSFNKITSLFKYIRPGGTTPAGLCFEAILDHITEMGGPDSDKYFINFSDGCPYFEGSGFSYGGYEATKHIKKQVNNMRAAGVKILSYYIDGNNLDDGSRSSFDEKYGRGSTEYVSVTDIIPLTKTLNKTFVER